MLRKLISYVDGVGDWLRGVEERQAPVIPLNPDSYASRVTSLKEYEEIVNISNEVLRNLRITQSYHDISLHMTKMLGRENVNWCSFATWASKTAGCSIRKEEPSKRFNDLINVTDFALNEIELFDRKLLSLNFNLSFLPKIIGALEESIDEVSKQISAGNLKVYRELAPVFIEMIELFSHDKHYDEGKCEDFVNKLKPGKTEEGGQDLLKVVCRHYIRAKYENDQQMKAQMIFFANNCTGLHEQMRLQINIQGGLEAPIKVGFKTKLLERLVPLLPLPLRSKRMSVIDEHMDVIEVVILRVWRKAVTLNMMELQMPERVLKLGNDVPALVGQDIFPEDLYSIQNENLIELLKKWDHTPNSLKGDGAYDWTMLTERMDYIIDLFRTRQQYQALYMEPFVTFRLDRFESPRSRYFTGITKIFLENNLCHNQNGNNSIKMLNNLKQT